MKKDLSSKLASEIVDKLKEAKNADPLQSVQKVMNNKKFKTVVSGNHRVPADPSKRPSLSESLGRLYIKPRNLILPIGKSQQMTLGNGMSQVAWSSGNTDIATVTKDGIVTAKSAGECVITAVPSNSKKKCSVKVRVPYFDLMMQKKDNEYHTISNPVFPYAANEEWLIQNDCLLIYPCTRYSNPSGPESISLYETDKSMLNCQVSDKSVLSCSLDTTSQGKVPFIRLKMLKNGEAKVTIKIKNPACLTKPFLVRNITFKVGKSSWGNVPVDNVRFAQSIFFEVSGEYRQLTPVIVPENATNQKVVWSSSDSAIAEVSSSGTVLAKKEGKCEISVKTLDGGHVASVPFVSAHYQLSVYDQSHLPQAVPQTFNPYKNKRNWYYLNEDMLGLDVCYVSGKWDHSSVIFDENSLICSVSNPNVVSVVWEHQKHATLLKLKLLRNGVSIVSVKLKKPNVRNEEFAFTAMFKLEVNNPDW